MQRPLFFLTLISLLAACVTSPTPTPLPAMPISPVTGLPSGTQGYPWWNDTVFYEIFVRSFYDSNGDGLGDFKGITAKLDYLKDLGVSGLWLMPIQPASSYHGYDVTDYDAVNPDYGTLADFKQLLAEAHKRGIRLIIDFVLNHTSDQHPWFVASQDPKSPFRSWYVWSKTDPGQQYWHSSASGWYYGFFDEHMPDLNYTNPDVTAKMEDVARYWLQDIGVDGFRLDAAKYLIEEGTLVQNSASTHAWYKNFRPAYKQLNPQALTIGEVWDIAPTEADYAQGDQLDLTFEFDLAQSLILSARTARAADAIDSLTVDNNLFKPNQFGTFITNHDQNRVISQLAGDVNKAKVAALMLLTSPGVPFIYYGEEIGMLGLKPDEEIRVPMQWTAGANAGFTTGQPWEALNPDYGNRNVATESSDPNSLWSLYRALIQLRNQHAALRVGDFHAVTSTSSAVFSILRVSQGEAVLVLINLDKNAVSNAQLSLASSALSAGTYHAVPMLGSGPVADLTVNAPGGFDGYVPLPSLPAYSGLILQLQAAK